MIKTVIVLITALTLSATAQVPIYDANGRYLGSVQNGSAWYYRNGNYRGFVSPGGSIYNSQGGYGGYIQNGNFYDANGRYLGYLGR